MKVIDIRQVSKGETLALLRGWYSVAKSSPVVFKTILLDEADSLYLSSYLLPTYLCQRHHPAQARLRMLSLARYV